MNLFIIVNIVLFVVFQLHLILSIIRLLFKDEIQVLYDIVSNNRTRD